MIGLLARLSASPTWQRTASLSISSNTTVFTVRKASGEALPPPTNVTTPFKNVLRQTLFDRPVEVLPALTFPQSVALARSIGSISSLRKSATASRDGITQSTLHGSRSTT